MVFYIIAISLCGSTHIINSHIHHAMQTYAYAMEYVHMHTHEHTHTHTHTYTHMNTHTHTHTHTHHFSLCSLYPEHGLTPGHTLHLKRGSVGVKWTYLKSFHPPNGTLASTVTRFLNFLYQAFTLGQFSSNVHKLHM